MSDEENKKTEIKLKKENPIIFCKHLKGGKTNYNDLSDLLIITGNRIVLIDKFGCSAASCELKNCDEYILK